MYSGCSLKTPAIETSCEQAAIVSALSNGESKFEAMVVLGETPFEEYPSPSGNARQLMADYGPFDVYCVRADLQYKRMSTQELFPRPALAGSNAAVAAGSTYAASTQGLAGHGSDFMQALQERANEVRQDIQGAQEERAAAVFAVPFHKHLSDWDATEVSRWVGSTLGLPQYQDTFQSAQVTGALLVNMEEMDLKTLVGVKESLHVRQILAAVHKAIGTSTVAAQSEDYAGDVIDMDQLVDYLKVLEKERIGQVASMKTAFDRLDKDGNGTISAKEIKKLFKSLRIPDAEAKAQEWITEKDQDGNGTVSFEEFCLAYTDQNQEQKVHSLVRSSKDIGGGTGGATPPLQKGTRVQARYKGGKKFYPGKITAVHTATVTAPAPEGARAGGAVPLVEGSVVTARYKQGKTYYPGKITAVAEDGTFDILYDDGGEEKGVASKFIKAKAGDTSTPSAGGMPFDFDRPSLLS
jgi:Ca2+-binding EF-hand superfamily protein